MSKHQKLDGRAGNDSSHDGGWGELAGAAHELESELRRFDELTTTVRKMPLDTYKAIQRAAKATTETASGQERVDRALGALVLAIKAVRERHEANAAALQVRGEEISARAEQFAALFAQFSALGEEGGLINQLLLETAAKQKDATTPEGVREVIAAFASIEERMSKLVDAARELGRAATAVSITDLADQAASLRQQMLAARNKVGLLKKGAEDRLPQPS